MKTIKTREINYMTIWRLYRIWLGKLMIWLYEEYLEYD